MERGSSIAVLAIGSIVIDCKHRSRSLSLSCADIDCQEIRIYLLD